MNSTQTHKTQYAKKSKFNLNNRSSLIIGLSIAVILVIFLSFTIYAFTYQRIFPNTYAAGVKISGLTVEKATDLLTRESDSRFSNAEFKVSLDGREELIITAKELEVGIDAKGASSLALLRGRNGSFPQRFFDVLKSLFLRYEIPAVVNLNRDSLNSVIDKLAEHDEEPIDASFQVDGATLTLHPAKDGYTLDKTELNSLIFNKFNREDYSPLTVSQELITAKRNDIDEIYKQVHVESKDAVLEQVDGEHKIIPHVVGVDFDLEAARIALDRSADQALNIPLTLTQPKITTLSLEATLFKDTLSKVTTYFSPKKVERTSNVRLSASLVNGTVLNPGEEFSYNNVVGPRTRQRGFKEAPIFAAGEIVDGLGGGICQVSSSLYMASLRADMKTTSRRNHAFYIDYAPNGEDATVVYGLIDFKFINTSKYPIKILAASKDNWITITIKGTVTEKKTVKFEKKVLSTRPFTERIVKDNSLKAGTRKIVQAGQEGITMEVYRLVYDANGKLLRREFENKTTYSPLVQIVNAGPEITTPTVQIPTEENNEQPEEKPEAPEKTNEEETPKEPQPPESPPTEPDSPTEEPKPQGSEAPGSEPDEQSGNATGSDNSGG